MVITLIFVNFIVLFVCLFLSRNDDKYADAVAVLVLLEELKPEHIFKV